MKKRFPGLAAVLTVLALLSASCASADNSTAVSSESSTAAPAQVSTEPATSPEAVDPLVGSWRIPPSPYGDDFACYIVLNADGSFMNVTNLFESGSSGPYTQVVSTNDTFRWTRTDRTTLELRYDYGDENGEFVNSLTYNPAEDALYMFGNLYATRDSSLVLDEQYR